MLVFGMKRPDVGITRISHMYVAEFAHMPAYWSRPADICYMWRFQPLSPRGFKPRTAGNLRLLRRSPLSSISYKSNNGAFKRSCCNLVSHSFLQTPAVR